MRKGLTKLLVVCLSALAIGTGTAVASPAASSLDRGPAPTDQDLRAPLGPFTFSHVVVPSSPAKGLGGGTIYYPDDTTQGTFGGVAVSPGFLSPESAVAWLGPRLASRGFVVFTISTLTLVDQPDSRGRQLLAALDYLTRSAPDAVRQRLDPQRLAVMGHSMGGGGALAAVAARPGIKAAVPLAPYHANRNWPTVTTPTMIIGGSRDVIAGVDSFALPMYQSMTSARDRALAVVNGANHFTFVQDDGLVGKLAESWLKRFVDGDTRYDQFLCPPTRDPGLTDYRASCPITSALTD